MRKGKGAFISYLRLLLLAVVAAGGFATAWAVLPRAQFQRVAHYASIVLMAFTILSVLLKFQKERPYRRMPQVIAMVAPVVSMGIYLAVARPAADLYALGMLAAGIVGALYGCGWHRQTSLCVRDGVVYGRNSQWWIAFWGGSLIFTQTMAYLRDARGLNVALIVTAFTTARAVTTSGGILGGINRVLRETVRPAGFCEMCGAPLGGSCAFCESCGTAIGEGGS